MNINTALKGIWMIFSDPRVWGFLIFLFLISIIWDIPKWIARRQTEKQEIKFRHYCRITGVDATDKMDGRQFEKWLAVKFEKMGYQVHLKSGTKDQGADLILRSKSGERICVQAKKSGKQNIGVAALGDLVRGMRYYQTPKGIVVTNQYFTKEMKEEASYYSDIELWDRERLVDELAKAEGFKRNKKHNP